MEALGKNGVQNKIVLYPNLCYMDACYNEVDLYKYSYIMGCHVFSKLLVIYFLLLFVKSNLFELVLL